MFNFCIFIFILFTANFILSMNFERLNEFKVLAYKSLNYEQQLDLSPETYICDRDKGLAAIEAFAFKVAGYAFKDQECDLQVIAGLYANYLIELREEFLSAKKIEVVDMNSAQARAAQLLGKEKLNSLQKQRYLENRDDAINTIAIFANYTFNLLLKHGLISSEVSIEEFSKYFIEIKIKELDDLYDL